MRAKRCRLAARRAQLDEREWVVRRRERTRQLIELGGLVVKAGLVELTEDDRAVILGALLASAAVLNGEERQRALVSWRRKGECVFAANQYSTIQPAWP
ncbi:MAG TPA: conjugal transfer protein TraD [Allosphingosinicella sp.]|nr:conjugal transfer protein TraD [Allosphingosinicella sp.]